MVSCIIPFHNEKGRIGAVLDVLLKITRINEIICINDASTDGGEQIIIKNYKTVKLITSNNHQGKSHAIYRGLQKAKGTYIFLLDADLQKLKYKEIDAIIGYVTTHRKIDMLLLKDRYPHVITQMTRHDIILTGKRIVKTHDLKTVFKHYAPNEYQIEIAINTYMQDHNKNVSFVRFSSKNTIKTEKIGLIAGSLSNLKMMSTIVVYRSILNYFHQILFFGHDEVHLSS